VTTVTDTIDGCKHSTAAFLVGAQGDSTVKFTTLACHTACLGAWLVLVSAASAQTAVSPPGRLLASNCFQCHGSGGVGGFERLAGRDADDIERDLRRLRAEDEREAGQNIMVRHARGYSDAQIRALAQWLARQPR
jgi:cytochrome subunit of sulfide dehydrogenase